MQIQDIQHNLTESRLVKPTLPFWLAARTVARAVTVGCVGIWYFAPVLISRKRNRDRVEITAAACRTFLALGSTYIKFGQVIASSPGLVGEDVADVFRSCLDTGPSIDDKSLVDAIEHAAGCSLADAYREFDPNPIGTASIAVVHRATTLAGDRVAIKVRRPGVKERVADDIRILRGLTRIAMSLGKSTDAAQLLDLIDDFDRNIQAELDFTLERGSIERIGERLRLHGFSMIATPTTYPYLSDDSVLVMELFDGVAIDNLDGIAALDVDARPLVDDVIRAWLITSLVDGDFHGDCHAGNLLVLRDGRLGLIDWGIVGKLDEAARTFLIRLLEGSIGDEKAWVDVADFFNRQYGDAMLHELGTREEIPGKLRDLLGSLLTAPFGQNSLAAFLERTKLQKPDENETRGMDSPGQTPDTTIEFEQGFVLWIKQLIFFERYARLHKRYRSIANYAIEVLSLVPGSRRYGLPQILSASIDIDHLHHVGHLVRDMGIGLDLYRRLGFQMTPPSIPVVSFKKGAPPTPFGVGNSHAEFVENNFVELLTVIADPQKIPDNATFVPLEVPEKVLSIFIDVVSRVTAKLNECLARFEGLHILVFRAPDVYAEAIRLSLEGIGHSGVTSTQRQSGKRNGSSGDVVRVLELDDPNNPVPEGRIAISGTPTLTGSHPNGAVGLVESVLCVEEAELPDFERRYEKYTNRQARAEGKTRIFDLGNSRITIVADSVLDTVLPGERPLALPAFVAYAVKVRDIGLTRKLLLNNGFSLNTSGAGDSFIPAIEALGTAIIFRQADIRTGG